MSDLPSAIRESLETVLVNPSFEEDLTVAANNSDQITGVDSESEKETKESKKRRRQQSSPMAKSQVSDPIPGSFEQKLCFAFCSPSVIQALK